MCKACFFRFFVLGCCFFLHKFKSLKNDITIHTDIKYLKKALKLLQNQQRITKSNLGSNTTKKKDENGGRWWWCWLRHKKQRVFVNEKEQMHHENFSTCVFCKYFTEIKFIINASLFNDFVLNIQIKQFDYPCLIYFWCCKNCAASFMNKKNDDIVLYVLAEERYTFFLF